MGHTQQEGTNQVQRTVAARQLLAGVQSQLLACWCSSLPCLQSAAAARLSARRGGEKNHSEPSGNVSMWG